LVPARTDHDRRDAQHAVRATVAIEISRYVRRIVEEAYAHVEQEATEHDGRDVDWSAVGIASAHRALASYGITVGPSRAIDAETLVLEPGTSVHAQAA
jgi:hypothetical protein